MDNAKLAGDLMSDWRKVRLGDYVNIKHGYAFKGEFFSESITPDILVTPGNFKIGGGFKDDKLKYYNGEYPEEYILKPDDVIITMTDLSKMTDTLGFTALVPYTQNGHYLHNQRIGLIQFSNDEMLPKFIYWRLRNSDYQRFIAGSASGSTVKHTSPTTIKSFQFELPPLAEQRGIAGVLSSLDDKIEINNRLNRKLEETAQAIFKAWFVDGAGDDWEEGCLNDILSVKGGGTPSTKDETYWNGNIPWVTPKDLSANPDLFLSNTSRKITKEGLSQISSGLLPIGTILLSSRAPIGYLSIADIEVAINQGFIAIIDDKGYSKYFIYFWIRNNIDYIISNANGSTFLEINKAVFKKLKITKPPIDLIAEFDELIEPIFEKIKINSKEIRVLEKMRDALLPKLMSGEIRVADIDRL